MFPCVKRARPEICFYDRLVLEPSPERVSGLTNIVNQMDDSALHKLKVISTNDPSGRTSRCGA